MAGYTALPYQLNDATSWNGLTRETHFINAFGDNPQYLNNIVTNMFSVNYGMLFDDYLNKFDVQYVDEDKMYKWKLRGRDERNIPLLECWEDEAGTVPVGTTNQRVGSNGQRFFMDFPEKYFTVTSVIKGIKDAYQLRVMSDPQEITPNRFRCEMQLVSGDDSFFIPITELTNNSRWAMSHGLSERYMSKDGADISFVSPFTMQNRISMFRLEHTIAGEMIDAGKNKPLVFGFQGEDGTVRTSWISQMEYELIRQFKLRKNRLTFYGKGTLREDGSSTMKGSSGNVIEAGLGIREQFGPSSKYYYDTLSFDKLVNTLLELSIGRRTMENRHFVIGTGEYGLRRLHQMVADNLSANDYTWMRDTTGRAYTWNDNDIQVKFGQFRGFASINGIKVSFMHMDHYDDPIYNMLMHPNGGPAESQRMTIMDMGSKQEPNIHKIRIRNFEPQYAFIPGIRDPYNKGGMGRMKQVASEVDGYKVMLMDKEGAVVIDPTRVLEFIPSILK